jgi:hypothetical protein
MRDKLGNHKLELLDTGTMSYARMLTLVEGIFDLDARRLDVMRADFAADVKGIPVSWFAQHVRAPRKQWVCDIGQHPRVFREQQEGSVREAKGHLSEMRQDL